MSAYGGSGTIYDSPPARPFTFKVGSADLNEQLGGGFQAAHIWVNNQSNQSLYLPDAPDVVPPGATRVVACSRTDVARATWTIPPAFAITQPGAPAGAAIIVFLNAGVDVSPDPGVTQSPQVTIASGQSIAVSAIQSTVTVAGTVNIGNTPSVTISGTPTVNINSGTVSISGTPNINIQSQSVTVNVNSPMTRLTDLTFAISSTTTQTTDVVPAGTHALCIGNPTGSHSLLAVIVKGHTSGYRYWPPYLSGGPSTTAIQPGDPPVVIPVNSVLDTQYDITATTGGSAPNTLNVLAVLDVESHWVLNNDKTPLFVRASGPQVGRNGSLWANAGFNFPAPGTRATITSGSNANARQALISYSGEVQCTGTATAFLGNSLNVVDGISGGSVIYKHTGGFAAVAGAQFDIERTDVAMGSSIGNSITIEWASNATNIQQCVGVVVMTDA